MLASQRSLASAQLSRNTLREIEEAPDKSREMALESFRRRNAILDAVFYDVGKITKAEAQDIGPWMAREGSILIVPPSGQGALVRCANIEAFAAAYEQRRLRILTVAGVGSSALGSAAYARNVADAFNEPVVAIVSGYGLADVLTEGLGGWFLFGALNRLRHQFEQLDNWSRRGILADTTPTVSNAQVRLGDFSLDTKTAIVLLSDRRFHFDVLTGHSKGNLVISEALFELDDGAAAHLGPANPDPSIVTVSAAVAMPSSYSKVIDVIGGIDGFGLLNSVRPFERVWPRAWHHTNTEEVFFHLPVTQIFRELIAERRV
jgi:hypothetical protein